MILLVPVHLLRDRRSIALVRVRLFRFPNDYKLFRLGIRQWAVQEGVCNAENRTVGRDSQGQRQYDYDQETGILQETANRDTHIRSDRLEQSQDSHVRATSSVRPAIRPGRYATFPQRGAKRITSHVCYP